MVPFIRAERVEIFPDSSSVIRSNVRNSERLFQRLFKDFSSHRSFDVILIFRTIWTVSCVTEAFKDNRGPHETQQHRGSKPHLAQSSEGFWNIIALLSPYSGNPQVDDRLTYFWLLSQELPTAALTNRPKTGSTLSALRLSPRYFNFNL